MYQLKKCRYFISKKEYAKWILAACFLMMPMRVQAAQAPSLPPHLIQSVGDQEIYEGMAALGMLECPVLEEENCELAFANVKNCVVRIQMGSAHGSGIIWALTPKQVVIATNRHVLKYWNEWDSYVYFAQGYYMDAKIIGLSEQYDVGFLAVDNEQFGYDELVSLRSAPIDEQVYDRLRQGACMFSVEPGFETGEAQIYEATMEDAWKYIVDFDAYMLYGHGFAKAGMSGGGTFDGHGYLIGMTTGGTVQNETASVPLPDLVRAYHEIVQENTLCN